MMKDHNDEDDNNYNDNRTICGNGDSNTTEDSCENINLVGGVSDNADEAEDQNQNQNQDQTNGNSSNDNKTLTTLDDRIRIKQGREMIMIRDSNNDIYSHKKLDICNNDDENATIIRDNLPAREVRDEREPTIADRIRMKQGGEIIMIRSRASGSSRNNYNEDDGYRSDDGGGTIEINKDENNRINNDERDTKSDSRNQWLRRGLRQTTNNDGMSEKPGAYRWNPLTGFGEENGDENDIEEWEEERGNVQDEPIIALSTPVIKAFSTPDGDYKDENNIHHCTWFYNRFVIFFFLVVLFSLVTGVLLLYPSSSTVKDTVKDENHNKCQTLMNKSTDEILRCVDDAALLSFSSDYNEQFERIREAIVTTTSTSKHSLDTIGSHRRRALCWVTTTTNLRTQKMAIMKRYIVAIVFYSMGGRSHYGSHYYYKNWMDICTDVCDWEGISCGINSHDKISFALTGLMVDSFDKSTQGTLPNEIGNLGNDLREIILGHYLCHFRFVLKSSLVITLLSNRFFLSTRKQHTRTKHTYHARIRGIHSHEKQVNYPSRIMQD